MRILIGPSGWSHYEEKVVRSISGDVARAPYEKASFLLWTHLACSAPWGSGCREDAETVTPCGLFQPSAALSQNSRYPANKSDDVHASVAAADSRKQFALISHSITVTTSRGCQLANFVNKQEMIPRTSGQGVLLPKFTFKGCLTSLEIRKFRSKPCV